eukprot:scaffold1418_cov114-Isochrysis_galbana.AAC.4
MAAFMASVLEVIVLPENEEDHSSIGPKILSIEPYGGEQEAGSRGGPNGREGGRREVGKGKQKLRRRGRAGQWRHCKISCCAQGVGRTASAGGRRAIRRWRQAPFSLEPRRVPSSHWRQSAFAGRQPSSRGRAQRAGRTGCTTAAASPASTRPWPAAAEAQRQPQQRPSGGARWPRRRAGRQ